MGPRRSILEISSGIVVLALCHAARAQYSLGDGHGLDASLQHGSGGYNNPVNPSTNYGSRNDIITGNVRGLGYFHDNVGYRAPNEFRGHLGSDELFPFLARSAPMNPSQGSAYGGASNSVYRASATVPLAQMQQEGNTNILLQRRDGLLQPVDISATAQPNGPGYNGGAGVPGVTQGRLLEVNSSPLTNIAIRPNAPSADRAALGQQPTTYEPNPANLAEKARISGNTVATGGQGTHPLFVAAPPSYSGSLLGAQIQARLDPKRVGSNMQTLDERVKQLNAAIFSPLGSTTAQPSDDVYMDLLTKVKQNERIASGLKPLTGPGAAKPDDLAHPTPGGPASPQSALLHPHLRGMGMPLPSLPEPDDAKVKQAAEAARQAMRRAYGLPAEQPAAAAQTQPNPATQPGVPAPDPLVQTLDYDLPPLETLAGVRDTRINQALRLAEDDMLAGKYLDAEARYRGVLDQESGHVMGRIGLVHAQIGAGLIRTAALNLRTLFDRHPELIAARYESRLLPSADRILWVRSQLDQMIQTTDLEEPAILLAYLGYQTDNVKLTRYGLDLAQARQPTDPLIVVLQRLWLEHPRLAPGFQAPKEDRPITAPIQPTPATETPATGTPAK